MNICGTLNRVWCYVERKKLETKLHRLEKGYRGDGNCAIRNG